MNFEQALAKLKDYLDKEYKSTQYALSRPLFKENRTVDYGLQRALGVLFFIETSFDDSEYPKLEALYNEYKEKMDNLRNGLDR